MYSDISLNSPRKANSCNKHLIHVYFSHISQSHVVEQWVLHHQGIQEPKVPLSAPRFLGLHSLSDHVWSGEERKRVRGLGENLGTLGTWKVQVFPIQSPLAEIPPCGPINFLGNVVSLESRRKMKGVYLCHMNYKWKFFVSLISCQSSNQTELGSASGRPIYQLYIWPWTSYTNFWSLILLHS